MEKGKRVERFEDLIAWQKAAKPYGGLFPFSFLLMKDRYDVVIVGAGVHGLAIAYYLCKRGIRNIAVLERGYLGIGNSGRNTAILRSNYRTPEAIPFYN